MMQTFAYDPINAPRVSLFSNAGFEHGWAGTFAEGDYTTAGLWQGNI